MPRKTFVGTLYADSKQFIKHDIVYFSLNRGRDRMLVGFKTTYILYVIMISAIHH